MTYLLDTHTFIWAFSQPENLSSAVSSILLDRNHTIFLSAATTWEIQIKMQTGKLKLPVPLPLIVETYQHENQFQLLSVTTAHTLALDELPFHHKDPFDRILIAQARLENLILLSRDPVFRQYDAQVVW